jgi:hypothetical protein
VDNFHGTLFLRWYLADENKVPSIRKVRFDELRQHLPSDTPTLTPEQRESKLRARRDAALRRYGY